jgi:hypothetical protein
VTPGTALSAPELPAEVRASLPTFFIIGAPKAGTTSLHRYLSEHPEIAMSSVKEAMCFAPPGAPSRWQERLSRYQDLFERPAGVRGESSTGYASYPWTPEVPERVHATVPDARIVYLVRDPIARALSHYAQNVWDYPWDVRSFDELVADLEGPMNMPIWCSRFGLQLERWLTWFDRERVLVLDERDLRRKRIPTVRRVLEFLEVDPGFTSDSWLDKHNSAEARRRPSRVGERLGTSGRAARAPLLRDLLTRPVPPPPKLTRRQRATLKALFRPDADRLRALTDLPLDHWSV